MLILIKGPLGSGKTTLAGRLVSRLGLEPVPWPLDDAMLAESQEFMGRWIDVAAYFADCRHLDLERVLTLFQMQHVDELPRAPRWRPGAPIEEMLDWRVGVFAQLYSGRFLPDLFELACDLVDSVPHAVVEGEALGTSLQDSSLTRMLRSRFAAVPMLRLQAQRSTPTAPEQAPSFSVCANGHRLSHDDLLAALSRSSDGGIAVAPEVGLSWSGHGPDTPIPPAAVPGASTPAGRQP